jgi:hypothetical protein
MPTHNPNGRSASKPSDERFRSRGEERGRDWYGRDDREGDRYIAGDRDRERYERSRWDERDTRWGRERAYHDDDREDDYRRIERHGQGQSGYMAGRYGEDRSLELQNRNEMRRGGYADRQTVATDERWTGRGGQGYWEDRSDRPGYRSGYDRGGIGYGGYGQSTGWRGDEPFEQSREMGRHDYYGASDRGGYGAQGPGPGRTGGYDRGYDQGYGRGYGRGYGYGRHGGYDQNIGYGPGQMPRGDHRGKGPKGYTRSDERIREIVCEALSDDDQVDASGIEVTVKHGDVILSGTVEDRQMKRMAEDVVERCAGVNEVQNQLRVQSERSQGA